MPRHGLFRFLGALACLALSADPTAAFGPPVPLTVPIAVVSNHHQTGFILPAIAISISRRDTDPTTPLRLDYLCRGLTPQESQDRAAEFATALTTALPLLDLDPHGLTVTVSCPTTLRLSGNSITAAIVVATAALLTHRTLVPGLVITGTVNPDGSLGPIGDLDLKAAAATAAGYTLLYPAVHPERPDGPHRPVLTIQDAYALLTH
jgi:hypothetical protein